MSMTPAVATTRILRKQLTTISALYWAIEASKEEEDEDDHDDEEEG